MKDQISLTQEQYNIIKALFNAVAKKSDQRSCLKHVYYNPEAKELVACDGTIMRVEPMDLGDKPIYFAAEDFAFKATRLSLHALNEYDPTIPYLDYDRVIPDREYKSFEGETPYLGLDFELLGRFLKSTITGSKCFLLIPTGTKRALKVFSTAPKDEKIKPVFLGVVMPMRVFQEPKKLDNLLD